MLILNKVFIFFILSSDISFKEPVEIDKLMEAMDECIMFSPEEAKSRIKGSRYKSLLPELKVGGKFEENDLETNKLAESSPYLLTNFKSGWTFEVSLRWTLEDLVFSREEQDIKKDYLLSVDKYISLQNKLSETYYRLIEIIKKFEDIKDPKEKESLEKEYNMLNSRINILTCHKYKTIHKKEE